MNVNIAQPAAPELEPDYAEIMQAVATYRDSLDPEFYESMLESIDMTYEEYGEDRTALVRQAIKELNESIVAGNVAYQAGYRVKSSDRIMDGISFDIPDASYLVCRRQFSGYRATSSTHRWLWLLKVE